MFITTPCSQNHMTIFSSVVDILNTLLQGVLSLIFSQRTLLRIFLKRVVQKNCIHQCFVDIWPTKHYIILYCFLWGFLLIFSYVYIWSLLAWNSILDCPDFWTTRITYSACPHSKNPFVSWSPITCLSKHMNLKQVRKKQKDLRQQKARHK